jgi:hypothetical protein
MSRKYGGWVLEGDVAGGGDADDQLCAGSGQLFSDEDRERCSDCHADDADLDSV